MMLTSAPMTLVKKVKNKNFLLKTIILLTLKKLNIPLPIPNTIFQGLKKFLVLMNIVNFIFSYDKKNVTSFCPYKIFHHAVLVSTKFKFVLLSLNF